MKGEIGTDTPPARHRVHCLVHIIAEVALMTKRKGINNIAVKKRCYVLGTAPVVSALVIWIPGESPAPNRLRLSAYIVAKLAEESRSIAQTFRPGVVSLGLKSILESLLKNRLQGVVVGDAIR